MRQQHMNPEFEYRSLLNSFISRRDKVVLEISKGNNTEELTQEYIQLNKDIRNLSSGNMSPDEYYNRQNKEYNEKPIETIQQTIVNDRGASIVNGSIPAEVAASVLIPTGGIELSKEDLELLQRHSAVPVESVLRNATAEQVEYAIAKLREDEGASVVMHELDEIAQEVPTESTLNKAMEEVPTARPAVGHFESDGEFHGKIPNMPDKQDYERNIARERSIKIEELTQSATNIISQANRATNMLDVRLVFSQLDDWKQMLELFKATYESITYVDVLHSAIFESCNIAMKHVTGKL